MFQKNFYQNKLPYDIGPELPIETGLLCRNPSWTLVLMLSTVVSALLVYGFMSGRMLGFFLFLCTQFFVIEQVPREDVKMLFFSCKNGRMAVQLETIQA